MHLQWIRLKLVIALLFFGFLLACANQEVKAPDKSAKNSQQSLIAERKKINTDLYFESFEFKPYLFSKSAGHCLQVAELKGKDWKALLESINNCAQTNQWLSVESTAQELIKTNVNSPWGPYYLSLAAEYNKDLPRSLWMIDLAIKKASSQMAILQYQKGRIFWLLEQRDLAFKEFTLAAKLDKSIYDANLFLAEIAYHELDYKSAGQKFKEVLNIESKNYPALLDGAECEIKAGDVKLAADYLDRAISSHPENLHNRIRLAQVYEDYQKLPEQALAAYIALKEAVAKGVVHDHPTIDLSEKIKSIEASLPKNAKDPKIEIKDAAKNATNSNVKRKTAAKP